MTILITTNDTCKTIIYYYDIFSGYFIILNWYSIHLHSNYFFSVTSNALKFINNQKGKPWVLHHGDRYNFPTINQVPAWVDTPTECSASIALNAEWDTIIRQSPYACRPQFSENEEYLPTYWLIIVKRRSVLSGLLNDAS